VPLGFNNIPVTPAFQRASKALDKFAGIKEEPSKPTESPADKAPEKPAEKPVEAKDTKPADQTQQDTQEQTDKPADQQQQTDGKKPKPSPWKLVDEWKGKYATLEKEYADYKTKSSQPADDPEKKQFSERVSSLEKENGDLKEKLKFVNYQESDEYKQQYEKPYMDSWQAGRSWVSKLKVTTPEGERPGTAEDFDNLVNLAFSNPEQASAMVEEMFPGKSSTVAAQLVKTLEAAQRASGAVEDFKKGGAEKMKQQMESQERQQKENGEFLRKTWVEANKTVTEHPEYGEFFKKRDNDPEWNQRLAKGFELANRAMSEDPRQPNLSNEQRKSIVERHAALLNRAAAFGALRHEVVKLRSQLEDREKALAAYEESEPGPGDANGNGRVPEPANGRAIDRIGAALESGKYSR